MENSNSSLEGVVVIGMDPPVSKNCGWSVVKFEEGKPILIRKYTQVLEREGAAALEDVEVEFCKLYHEFGASVLCMERQMGGGLFFARAKLNEFVGVVKLFSHRHGLKVVEVSPGHLKLIIAGHGSATKPYMIENIVKTFDLDDGGPEHECDAAALAMCYFIDSGWAGYEIKVPYSKKIKNAEAKARSDRKKKIAANKAKRLAAEQAKAAAMGSGA